MGPLYNLVISGEQAEGISTCWRVVITMPMYFRLDLWSRICVVYDFWCSAYELVVRFMNFGVRCRILRIQSCKL